MSPSEKVDFFLLPFVKQLTITVINLADYYY